MSEWYFVDTGGAQNGPVSKDALKDAWNSVEAVYILSPSRSRTNELNCAACMLVFASSIAINKINNTHPYGIRGVLQEIVYVGAIPWQTGQLLRSFQI